LEKSELIEELKKIVASGIKNGEIEKAVLMGRNSLSGILKGYRPIGKARFMRLEEYVKAFNRKKIIVVEDEAGNFTIDSKPVKLVWEDSEPSVAHQRALEELMAREEKRQALREQLAAIKAEVISKDRNTPLGKQIWEKEQANKIKQIEYQLINL